MDADATLALSGLTLQAAVHEIVVRAVRRHRGDSRLAAAELGVDPAVVIAAVQDGTPVVPAAAPAAPRQDDDTWLKLTGRKMDEIYLEAIRRAANRNKGDRTAASKELGISRSTVIAKLKAPEAEAD